MATRKHHQEIMRKDIYPEIIYICLFLLAILPLGSAFNLTWKELVRLFVIDLGLVYIYIRYIKKASPVESEPFNGARPQVQRVEGKGNLVPTNVGIPQNGEPRTSNFEPLLLSIVYIFIITQFDPATGAIGRATGQDRLNWFFVTSSCLISIAFIVSLSLHFTTAKIKQVASAHSRPQVLYCKLSSLDRFVIAIGAVLFLAIILSNLVVAANRQLNALGAIKIFEYVILYFLVTRTFSSIKASQVTNEKFCAWFRRVANNHLQLTLLLILSIFFVTILIGGYRISSAFHHFKEAQNYYFDREYDLSFSQFEKVYSLNKTLDLGYLSGKKLKITRFGYRPRDREPTKNSLGGWEYTRGFALDSRSTSIGVDLGKESIILKIRLISSRKRKTRIDKGHLGVYFGNDNKSYEKYEGNWRFRHINGEILIDRLAIRARFVKVNCSFSDRNYQFSNTLRDMIQVYGL